MIFRALSFLSLFIGRDVSSKKEGVRMAQYVEQNNEKERECNQAKIWENQYLQREFNRRFEVAAELLIKKVDDLELRVKELEIVIVGMDTRSESPLTPCFSITKKGDFCVKIIAHPNKQRKKQRYSHHKLVSEM